jgi:uncharacterized protein (TIGR00299 family) protein
MRALFLDCFSGISGDMTVGALCDLGVNPSTFEWELSKLALGDFHMHFERAARQTVTGIHFSIHEGATHSSHSSQSSHETDGNHGKDEKDEHHHEHEHHHHHHHEHEHHHHHEDHGRSHREIRELIEKGDLSPAVKKHALGIFARIAVAEGRIHGVPAEDVHFHEVGALDSIADVVCACVGMEQLAIEKVLVSALHDGHGWIDCAHGRFPVPAPATLEILKGVTIGQIDEPHELITPTGAAIVMEFAAGFGSMPPMRVDKIGYGLGSRDLVTRPNVLRAVLGELAE